MQLKHKGIQKQRTFKEKIKKILDFHLVTFDFDLY